MIETLVHPPQWLVNAVDARGEWPGIRYLAAISDVPVLHPDGTVWQTPGYDPISSVLYKPSESFPEIPHEVTLADAQHAVDALLEVVGDFHFASEEHRSAWLAALLTPFARFAFAGPAPLNLFDANVRGAGKGLLARIIGWIAMGCEIPVCGYSHNSDEMRKVITSVAMAGDRLVLLDNIEGTLGNDALDRALTTTRWKDRLLGINRMVDLPLPTVWFATGNNVLVQCDTARRINHIRLDVMHEHPEERHEFQHPDLIDWVREQRPRLVVAVLTILSGFCRAGRPSQGLTPFGSFEGWSDLVRQALVWAGQPDPCLTRAGLAETSDTATDALKQLREAWWQYDPNNNGIVASVLVDDLYPQPGEPVRVDEAAVAMRAALENFVECQPGKTPDARQVGNRLRGVRRRVIDGEYFATFEKDRQGAIWRIWEATAE